LYNHNLRLISRRH